MKWARAQVALVVGLGFGDEGKGTTVDWLARRHSSQLVVRFNGGSQAGHNVVLPDGRHHCFSQFGSGTFAGAGTHLSRFMMVNPISFLSEERALQKCGITDAFKKVTVEAGALITTPFHVAANRLHELARGNGRHGTCGMGIGETAQDALAYLRNSPDVITAEDLDHPMDLRLKLKKIQERKRFECEHLDVDRASPTGAREWEVLTNEGLREDIFDDYAQFLAKGVQIVDESWLKHFLLTEATHVIFEGAQGVLLDEDYGFHPHTTWSHCTFENANRLLADLDIQLKRIGVLRTFHTRHGAGPFLTEDPAADDLSGHDHNRKGRVGWQGDFRTGYFDLVAAKYAADAVGGVDEIALTHLDRIENDSLKVCVAYETSAPVQPREQSGFLGIDYEGKSAVSEIDCRHFGLTPQARLVYQESLTRALFDMKPLYTETSVQSFIRALEKKLWVYGVTPRVSLTSWGPTYKDKKVHD